MLQLKTRCALTLLLGVTLASPLQQDAFASRFTYYNQPTPFSGPCDLATGSDGAIWAQDILADLIARVDPITGNVEEFEIPYEQPTNFSLVQNFEPTRSAFSCAIRPGADGNLYAAAGLRSQFLRINPTTKEIKVYTPPLPNTPAGNLQPFNDMWTDDEGMYFTLTTANVLFYFEYATESFTPYYMPTPASGPLGVFKASDGNFWICELLANKIARFNPRTKEFTEYSLPLPGGAGPAVVRAESPKGLVWFTCFFGGSIGSIDIHTGQVNIIADGDPASLPAEDTVDGDGNIWYSTAARGTLNKLNIKTYEITKIKQPSSSLITPPISIPPPFDIAITYGPGNAIWFAQIATNRIGKYQL